PPPVNNVFALQAASDYATPNVDFTGPFTVTLTWNNGVNFIDVPITILDDTLVEFDEDIRVTLRPVPANPAPNGATVDGTLTIEMEDRVAAEHSAGSVDPAWNRDFFLGTAPPNNASPGANNVVHSVAAQTDGRTVIGGDFTAVNTVPRNRIARLNSDGSIDTGFNPGNGANGSVNSVILQTNGQILVAGGFSSINSTPRGGIARL